MEEGKKKKNQTRKAALVLVTVALTTAVPVLQL